MANRDKFEQLLEFIVNGEQKKAEELFHSLVVAKSREIYEGLYEQELADVDLEETSDEDKEDEEIDEAMDDDDDMSGNAYEMGYNAAALHQRSKHSNPFEGKDDQKAMEWEEGWKEGAADTGLDETNLSDQGDVDIEEIGGDPSDDMMNDIEASDDEEGEEEGEEGEEGGVEDRVADLEDALDELKAEFEKLMGGDDMDSDQRDMDMDADADKKEMFAPAFEEEIEEIDLTPAEQMREYVEKIGDAYKGGKVASSSEASGANTKSIVAKKNDMGGTTANIAKGGTGSEKGTAGGLLNPSTKEDNAGNINVPGGKGATKLSAVAKGHGAEKKGAGEDAQNKKSIIGSR